MMYSSFQVDRLYGSLDVPGDKSLSHRALILAALAEGKSQISGLLNSTDIQSTIKALRTFGVEINQKSTKTWEVYGVGLGGFQEPDQVIDLGNSGTAVRLLSGVVATQPITTFMTGDPSLNRRPMRRVMTPLQQMGARFISRQGEYLPFVVQGSSCAIPITYHLPVPSAQVKSALLLAGLNVPGQTTVIESTPTRDHTERLLRTFGVTLSTQTTEQGDSKIHVCGEAELRGARIDIPSDMSSAAFFLVAGLICPDSEIVMKNIGINPRRMGLIETLWEMGGHIALYNKRDVCHEPVADITVRSSRLQGVCVPRERTPSMIDEYPILAIAAACAEGKTHMNGLHELRHKESNRLETITQGLQACGVDVEQKNDSLTIYPTTSKIGGKVHTAMDHRIAMSFLIFGMVCDQPVILDDASCIQTSFPSFITTMQSLGAKIKAYSANQTTVPDAGVEPATF